MEHSTSSIRPQGAHFTIAGILAGFSFALGMQVLQTDGQSLATILSAICLLAAGCLLLGMTLYGFITTPFIQRIDGSGDEARIAECQGYERRAQNIGFSGMFLLLVGIVLAAWARSAPVGIAVTIAGIVAALYAINYSGAVVLIDGELPEEDKKVEEKEDA